jgi:hypothetical protein
MVPVRTSRPNGTPSRGCIVRISDGTASYQIEERQIFQRLAVEWHSATDHLSSPTQIALHPAYQRIIGMGRSVIPFILEDLRRRGGQWYWALRAITGEMVVQPEDAGNIRLMKDRWLRWGKEHGYIV